MTQTSNRFFDEMARLMNDAAGVAQGVRREFDTLLRSQAERILRDLDVVKREEFEAVKDMARLAREENDALKARIAALEAKAEKTQQEGQGLVRRDPLITCLRGFLALLECCRYNPPRSRPPAPLEACRVRRRRKSRLFPSA
jgi:BMFP domain-containing protein YqiC